MTQYDKDTSAEAVILCDYGYFSSNNFYFTRNVRIKILKKEGSNWANYIYQSDSKTSVNGYTFNIENGEIIKEKLKNESVFKEEVTDNLSLIRVAMPNVKVGSIIDLEYSFQGIPQEWKFQYTIPVKWSELIIEENEYFKYSTNFFGFEYLYINSDGRWVAKNMPAFNIEPFMNSKENYLTKFEFDFFGRGYSISWENCNDILLNNAHFGKTLSGSLYLNDIKDEINEKNYQDIEKLKEAYNRVKEIKWNEKERLITESLNLSTVYKNKIGNSAEINLVLIQLLDKLGFEVYPVVLSTRENGILSPIQPSLNKLNYTVALVILNNQEILLDATEKYLPAGLLPPRCININGRLIDNKKSKWVDLVTKVKDSQTSNYNLLLNENGTLTGKLEYIRKDYGAFYFRKKYKEFNNDNEYIKHFEEENPGLVINKFDIQNFDSIYGPVQDSYQVDIENRTLDIGDKIYINPMLTEQLKENPFKSEERKYPIDMIHPIEYKYIINLQIPKNYIIESIPESIVVKLPDNSAGFSYRVSNSNNIIQIKYQFNISNPIFISNQYKDLREFYNQIIKKHSEQIILTKKNETI
ncbi:MAG: hypothetical protein A2041_07845 [Bacteroidetes bacterium GWA2_31_9b]|nr:MAG: hypothetical protein A2041_07845 [Bacteroidetes bacterium GWA2_31_9b]